MRRRIVAACVGLAALCAVPSAVLATPVEVKFVCFDKVGNQAKPNRRGVIRGTPRADVIIVLRRKVTVFGRGGNDRICTGKRNDFVSAGNGNDLVSSGAGADRVSGGSGADYLNGRGGSDRLDGGVSGADTIVGGPDPDVLRGGEESPDHLFGGAGDDSLDGGNGDQPDLLVGGEGADAIEGGSGCCDTASFSFEQAAVQVDLAAQGTPLANGDVLSGIENLEGSVFEDVLNGDDKHNILNGDDGNDSISGRGGSDQLEGGAGDDLMDGGSEMDRLTFLTSGEGVHVDLALGSAQGHGDDSLLGFENVQGSAHDDEIAGDDGPNELDGFRGINAVRAEAGDDRVSSFASGDAGPGEDSCVTAFQVQSCEQHVVVDPMAYSEITSPAQGATMDVSALRVLEGTTNPALGPDPEEVQVGLRRLSGAGCFWWNARRTEVIPWHCSRPIWNDANLAGTGDWTERIPSPMQLLVAGRYQARSRIHQPGYTEPVPGYSLLNLVEFRLR